MKKVGWSFQSYWATEHSRILHCTPSPLLPFAWAGGRGGGEEGRRGEGEGGEGAGGEEGRRGGGGKGAGGEDGRMKGGEEGRREEGGRRRRVSVLFVSVVTCWLGFSIRFMSRCPFGGMSSVMNRIGNIQMSTHTTMSQWTLTQIPQQPMNELWNCLLCTGIFNPMQIFYSSPT